CQERLHEFFTIPWGRGRRGSLHTTEPMVASVNAFMAERASRHGYATRTANFRNPFLKADGPGATVRDVQTVSAGGGGVFGNLNSGVKEKITDRGANE